MENKTDGDLPHRRFTLRTVIIIMAAFLVVSVGVVVPVCIFCVDFPVKPSFDTFDQEKDYTITAVWKNVAGADSYDVEFCYDDPMLKTTVITKGNTINCRFTRERRKGNYYFRVRAVKNGRKGKYSDWIKKDIEAWRLPAPSTVTIDPTDLTASWLPVNYRDYNGYSHEAPAYVLSFAWETEGEAIVWTNVSTIGTVYPLSSALFSYGLYENYYQGYIYDWPGDVTLHFKVAAVNHNKNVLGGFNKVVGDTYEEKALNTIYNDTGDYGEVSLVITKEIFDALAK